MKLAAAASLILHLVVFGGIVFVPPPLGLSRDSVLIVTPVSMEADAPERNLDRPSSPVKAVPSRKPPPLQDSIAALSDSSFPEAQPEATSIEFASPEGLTEEPSYGVTSDVEESEADFLSVYLLDVRDRLAVARRYPWRARLLAQEGVAEIRFRIAPSGESEEVELVRSSAFDLLDREAIATVARAGRFPPPPTAGTDGIVVLVPIWFQLESTRSE